MKPTYPALAATILAISQDTPLHLLRQDLVYELYRRGVLELDASDTLKFSGEGVTIVETLQAGGRAPSLEDNLATGLRADAADAILERYFRVAG